ncbi:MAG: hypothetical protein ACMUJM_20645 [bacterium]
MDNRVRTEILAEYAALRNEIIKRMEIRNYLMTFAVAAAGTLLTFGNQKDIPVLVMLIFPIFSVLLAFAWMNNDMHINNLGKYIKNHIESTSGIKGINWQNYKNELKKRCVTIKI